MKPSALKREHTAFQNMKFLNFFSVLRIRDVYPGSRIQIFTHPGSRVQKQQQKRGVKIFFFHTFFCSHKFHITENYFIFEMLKKKIWANFKRIIEIFTQKIVSKLSKIWVWDPGSGIGKKPILDPGSRGQKSTGSRIRIRNNAFSILFGSFCPSGSVVEPKAKPEEPYLFALAEPERITVPDAVPKPDFDLDPDLDPGQH
jgi:hypothetical protein